MRRDGGEALSELAVTPTRTPRIIRLGWRVFFRSTPATTAWARGMGISMSETSPQPRAKVYLSAGAWLWFRLTGGVKVTALHVSQLYRLGNALHQLGNALLLAQHVKVAQVVIPPNETFVKPVTTRAGIVVTTRLRRPSRRWGVGAIVVGRFFFDDEFPDVCRNDHIPAALDGIRESVIDPRRVATVSPDTLVIHLRGGDVFTDPPPRGYGQPPLAFYVAVIESRPWTSVAVVSEDTRNPVHAGLLDYCAQAGIATEVVSGGLLADIHFLVGAQHLALSTGSFGRAIISLSECVREVWEFEDTAFLYPLAPTVTHHRVIDRVGDYRATVLSGNWMNTVKQRELMLSYPGEHLAWTDTASD